MDPIQSDNPTNAEPTAPVAQPLVNIPEKFRRDSLEDSVKALVDSYSELERKLHTPKDKPEDKQSLQIPEQPADDGGDNPWEEFQAAGDFSEEAITALSKKTKISADVIKRHIELEAGEAEASFYRGAKVVGGEDRLNALIEWGRDNLSDAQRAAINKDLLDRNKYEFTLLGLNSMFESATGNKGGTPNRPGLVQPAERTSGNITAAFQSKEEFQKAVRDPRYNPQDKQNFDPAYVQDVTNKFAAFMKQRNKG